MTTSVVWSSVLDRLEDDLRRAEREPATMPAAWQPPTAVGPLPTELADRATRLVARQQAVMRNLAAQIHTTARHQSLVDALGSRSTHHHRPAVYVDVNA